jgi:O-antigen/teichoic acid export membrane protein
MFYEAAVNGWLRPLLQVGFAFAFSFVSADVHGLGLTFIGMQTGALLFGLYGYYRHASLSALWKSFFTGTAQPKLHAFSLAQNANMLFNKITSGLDLLLLPVLGVPAFEVGAYATISGLFRELRQIKLAFSTALAPFLAAFLHQEKKIETSKRITYVSGLLMLLITPTLLFLWQFHVPLISLFLPRYEADFSLIALLSFVPLLYTVFSLMGNVLVAAGLSRPLLFNSVLATASLAGLLFVFVPEFGLTGAAFSSAGAMAIMSFLEVWQAKRLCGVTFLLKIWLPLVLACFFLLLVTFFLNNFGALQTYTMLVPWLLYGIIAFRYREFFKLPDFA